VNCKQLKAALDYQQKIIRLKAEIKNKSDLFYFEFFFMINELDMFFGIQYK